MSHYDSSDYQSHSRPPSMASRLVIPTIYSFFIAVIVLSVISLWLLHRERQFLSPEQKYVMGSAVQIKEGGIFTDYLLVTFDNRAERVFLNTPEQEVIAANVSKGDPVCIKQDERDLVLVEEQRCNPN